MTTENTDGLTDQLRASLNTAGTALTYSTVKAMADFMALKNLPARLVSNDLGRGETVTSDQPDYYWWRRRIPDEHRCRICRGTGTRMYGSTATWRGGMGGAHATRDICDSCWGSGDKTEPWLDLRELYRERNQLWRQLQRQKESQ